MKRLLRSCRLHCIVNTVVGNDNSYNAFCLWVLERLYKGLLYLSVGEKIETERKEKFFQGFLESKWCCWRENQSIQRSGPVLCSSALLPPLLPTVPVSQENKHLHYSFQVECGKYSEKPLLEISTFIICF